MTTPDVAALLERARAWAAEDPDDETRTELEAIVADVENGGDPSELADRFDGTLEFGTAGLRGALGAGPNRMNRVVVTRAAAGLASYLRDIGAPRNSAVVIGYDARHNSDVFAQDTAEVMAGAGMRALVLPRPLPTPLLAFAIRELGCVAGVMAYLLVLHGPAIRFARQITRTAPLLVSARQLGLAIATPEPVSYTHLTLPTN